MSDNWWVWTIGGLVGELLVIVVLPLAANARRRRRRLQSQQEHVAPHGATR